MLEYKDSNWRFDNGGRQEIGEDGVERELERTEWYWMNSKFDINWNWEYYKSIYTLRE